MKKIYTAILLIALTLFISCDENKAKDEIKKALDKTVDEADKPAKPTKPQNTPQGSGATLTKPVLSAQRVRMGVPITFPKVKRYKYTLKKPANFLTLSDVEGDTTKKQVSSTKVITGIIVVATKDGKTIESDPIDFLFYVANKAALQAEIERAIKKHGNEADLNYIDTSQVTDMSNLFDNNATFNGDISKWDTSSVTTMYAMFYNASAFNQPLNNWTVSSVRDMRNMFNGARAFNQPLNSWHVSSVTDMRRMFKDATIFNQSLNSWNVSNVTDMNGMFYNATSFNQPLTSWDVSSVNNISYMFGLATSFNQDLRDWAAKSGRKSTGMFKDATAMQALNKPSWAR